MHLAYYPPRFPEIPIKLPDGRFLRVTCWLESSPPQVGDLEIIDDCIVPENMRSPNWLTIINIKSIQGKTQPTSYR